MEELGGLQKGPVGKFRKFSLCVILSQNFVITCVDKYISYLIDFISFIYLKEAIIIEYLPIYNIH